jgi:hypothetical protein
MPNYVFTCAQGHQAEMLRPRDVILAACPECGEDAKREQVYRVGFSGFASTPSGQHDFSQDYRRFQEASETIDAKVSQRERDSGQQIATPFYQEAKKRADKLASLGVTADSIKT